jgi:rubrerythrin
MSVNTENKEKVEVSETELVPASEVLLTPFMTKSDECEYMDYFGQDSTSLMEITSLEIINDEDGHADALKNWEKKLNKAKGSQKDEVIAEGIELALSISHDTNKLINVMSKNLAERAIIIGAICNQLKKHIKIANTPWIVWAEQNLSFIGKRNREKYMMLANRSDCYPYSFLGIDRVEMLCSATKASKEKDPIGTLLQSHSIIFDPEAETNLAEFKAKIDAALSIERLTKKGLNVDFNLVVNLLYVGVEVDNALIKTLSNIQECGGDTTKHLEKLLLTGGKESADYDGAKRPEDFNKLSNRLIQTIDYLIEGCSKQTVSIDQLDKNSYTLLISKLAELSRAAHFTVADEDF